MAPEPRDPIALVAQALVRALRDGRPLSLVRLGHGEALTLSRGATLATQRDLTDSSAAADHPDIACRDRLAQAVRLADIVGLASADGETGQPLLSRALRDHGINLSGKIVADAAISWQLYRQGHFGSLLLEQPRPRILLVGQRAPQLEPVLARAGVRVVGTVSPVRGCQDVDRVLRQMGGHPYDIALVSAGVAAVPICAEGARSHRGIHLDIGRLADELIFGGRPLTGGRS